MPDKYETRVCKRHGETEFVLEGRGYYRCVKCRSNGVSNWRRRKKRKIVEEFGGECFLCGYSGCMEALTFHHADPDEKEFKLGSGMTRSIERQLREAGKCVLLCMNCHTEVHLGMHPELIDGG